MLARMGGAIDAMCREVGLPAQRLAGVGVACAGPIDVARGAVRLAPNLGWRDVDVVQPLAAQLGVPVFLENDANAAAVGEWWQGAGRGTRYFIYVTVSTGIGGGIVIGGQLYTGAHGAAGEIGHTVIVVEDGPLCNCGRRGCLEAMASGTAIARRAAEALQAEAATGRQESLLWGLSGGRLSAVDARMVAEAARRGDALAEAVLERTWRYLGAGLVNLMNLFDPEVIALGGGVSRMGEAMLGPLRRYVAVQAVAGPAESTRLELAQLGPNAGLVGAAAIALARAASGVGVPGRP